VTDITDVVRTQGLTRRFDSLTAVDKLDLTVQAGEIFGLVGPDGAGKTTTLRMLAGVITPSEGTAEVLGHDVVRDGGRLRRRIGYVAQRFSLYGDLTVAENMRFAADVYGVSRGEWTGWAAELLAFSGLAEFQDRLADNLSGGMKQKLALSCALIHRPQVLLLDEPTAGVDPVSRRDLWRILYRLPAAGFTVILSTAYLDEAERCHRVGFLANGRLVAVGTPDELRAQLPLTILEVSLAQPSPADLRQARELALQSPQAVSAQLFGDRLHVLVAHPDDATPVVDTIRTGVAVTQAVPVPPTLEDVFLAVRDGEVARG
jgi:ABC-2 type transport system ATP-binding protein